MPRIREVVEIDAPVQKVWHAVHEDLRNVPKWSRNISRVEMLNGDVPGRGSEIRYDVKLPGGRVVGLEFEQATWNPPKRCAGTFINGPIKGRWSYAYSGGIDASEPTKLVFEADYELTGMLRFVGGVFASQYAAGIRDNMQTLKKYIESSPARKPRESAARTRRKPAVG